ncbi:MAG: CoA transferase [Dehalococcoidia bacterium]|nr:CoA transferase [Dehalococcoidia bacterium]
MPGPLEGIKVIDWTTQQMGPVASAMLGDLGADVIKVEDRVRGDNGRGWTGIMGLAAFAKGGRNFYFEGNNRNKRGITLDIKKPQGQEVIYRLAKTADIFVQNFRPGAAEKLGIGYEDLKKHNPKIIFASASGYGAKGPEANRPATDPAGMARSGMLIATSRYGMPPHYYPGAIADQMGAIMLAYGVLAALVARERLGVGQKVDTSHLGSMVWLQALNVHQYLVQGRLPNQWQRERVSNPISNCYRCADDRWLFIGLSQAERFWPDFCQAVGIEELRDDPHYATVKSRMEHREKLIGILDDVFASRTSIDWSEHFKKNYPEFIFEVVRSIAELPQDPQVLDNDYIVDFNHPVYGTGKTLGIPIQLSATPGSLRRTAPEFGQHTEEVLMEVGYTWEEIAQLKEAEVI